MKEGWQFAGPLEPKFQANQSDPSESGREDLCRLQGQQRTDESDHGDAIQRENLGDDEESHAGELPLPHIGRRRIVRGLRG